MNRKYLLLLFICFHLFVIIIYNIQHTYDSFFDFYNSGTNKVKRPKTLEKLDELVNSDLLFTYGTYTGTLTGYGFYAPNVASQVVFTFYVKDSFGNTLAAKSLPTLKTREGINRFSLCSSIWLEKLVLVNTNELFDRYLKALMRQIALNIKNDYPVNSIVETKVYIYEYPKLSNSLKGEEEKLILSNEFIF